jgi:Putative transposase
VLAFYAYRAVPKAKTGAVTVVQRTASDLRVNPHLHVVFLDAAYCERGETLEWRELGHIKTREVGDVLERAVRSMLGHLRRRGALEPDGAEFDLAPDEQVDGAAPLVASAVSGHVPPAGPQWRRGLVALESHPLSYDKHLCASMDGFTLHAATHAGALDDTGREALLRYVLRPPIAQERVQPQKSGLVRIALKRAYADGTFAVDMDPLSLLFRLATSVPPPRFHTVKYAGVLAPASRWRSRIAPAKSPAPPEAMVDHEAQTPKRTGRYRPWAELLKRTFGLDVLECPTCHGRMKLLAMVTEPESVRRYLLRIGEPTDVPARSPSRGPPFWKSLVLRLKMLGVGRNGM